jgi:hypothetical protein
MCGKKTCEKISCKADERGIVRVAYYPGVDEEESKSKHCQMVSKTDCRCICAKSYHDMHGVHREL